MQLLTPLGFRYVSCRGCAKQRWSRGWLCECGVPWHTCDIHRIDPAVHRSAKPPKRTVVKEKAESNYKDSERAAPEAVQSTTYQPQKRATGNRLMHAHGEDTRDEVASKLVRPIITESWKRKIDDNQRRRSSRAEQVVVAQSTEDEVKERRADFFSQIEVLPVGSKRQRIDEDTSLERTSRRSLRESLIAKATKLRHKQGRRLDDHLIHPAADKPKPKRIRLQGDDAITRLINLGRQHQGEQLGERVPRCDGRE